MEAWIHRRGQAGAWWPPSSGEAQEKQLPQPSVRLAKPTGQTRNPVGVRGVNCSPKRERVSPPRRPPGPSYLSRCRWESSPALLPTPHCSAGSFLGRFTFSLDPCNSVKRSQATMRPCCSCCLVPPHRVQLEAAPAGGLAWAQAGQRPLGQDRHAGLFTQAAMWPQPACTRAHPPPPPGLWGQWAPCQVKGSWADGKGGTLLTDTGEGVPAASCRAGHLHWEGVRPTAGQAGVPSGPAGA